MAIKYGASAIGLVGRMPSGPGPIEDELIRSIAQTVPPMISTFLLTCETSAMAIFNHHARTNTNTIQLVDRVEKGTYQYLRDETPALKVVQVIHVIDENSIEEAIEVSAHVDAILLDSGNPLKKIKELGGTGRVHNWKLSRQIVEQVSIPVILAGGLNPSNVQQAIDEVQPFAVDVCSGLRTNGVLDEGKLEAFCRIA